MLNKLWNGRPARKIGDPELEAVADRVHSAAIHLLRAVRRVDEEAGLTPSRLSALSVLVFRGPMTLGQLASAEQVRPPTVTRLVTALERLGLVARSTDAADARISHVRATPAGRKLLARARDRRVQLLVGRMKQLRAADVATLSRAAGLVEHLSRER